jgi:hypothetical protein
VDLPPKESKKEKKNPKNNNYYYSKRARTRGTAPLLCANSRCRCFELLLDPLLLNQHGTDVGTAVWMELSMGHDLKEVE